MTTYDIYQNKTGVFEAVKQGWSWPGFFFSWIWALVKGMPGLGFGLLIGALLVGALLGALQAPEGIVNLLGLAISLWVGSQGNKMREKKLIEKGYDYVETLTATSAYTAIVAARSATLTHSDLAYVEQDNAGTRHDRAEHTEAICRADDPLEPHLRYQFESEADAKKAMLALDFIHVAQDTGNLICTRPLAFGVYGDEGHGFEAFLMGKELTATQWQRAKTLFAEHGGITKSEHQAADALPASHVQQSEGTF